MPIDIMDFVHLTVVLSFISVFEKLGAENSTLDEYVIELPNGEIRPAPFNPALRNWDSEKPLDQINYSSDRIVGGREAKISEVPYQVAIMLRNNGIWCGGAIYNEHTILSAAHCFPKKLGTKDFLIVAGKTNLKKQESQEQLSGVAQILNHPNYDAKDQTNDLAIVKLKTPLCFNSNTQPILLTKSGSLATGSGVISGWGYTKRRKSEEKLEDSKFSRTLKLTTLNVIPKSQCMRKYASNPAALTIAEHEGAFCAGSKKNDDNCQGDSGGPFVCGSKPKEVLCGIVSTGIGCGQPDTPAFYTELGNPALHRWIIKNAGEQSNPCEASGKETTDKCSAPDVTTKLACPESSEST